MTDRPTNQRTDIRGYSEGTLQTNGPEWISKHFWINISKKVVVWPQLGVGGGRHFAVGTTLLNRHLAYTCIGLQSGWRRSGDSKFLFFEQHLSTDSLKPLWIAIEEVYVHTRNRQYKVVSECVYSLYNVFFSEMDSLDKALTLVRGPGQLPP